MKYKLLAVFLPLLFVASASGQAVLFQDDFSADTLAAGYSSQGVVYNATAETVTITRGYSGGGNYLEIGQTFDLESSGAAELIIAFDYAFGTFMYGSAFTVEYNDNTGTGWQVVDTITFTHTNADDNGTAANPYSVTITVGETYNFTDGATIRIRGSSATGQKGYHIDNLSVATDQAGEPGRGTVILISGLSTWFLLGMALLFPSARRRSRIGYGRA